MRARSTSRLRRVAVALGAVAGLVTTVSCSSGDAAPSSSAAGSSAAGSGAEGSSAGGADGALGRGAYLALGDSVPFGFRGGATADFSEEDEFVGYPELVGAELGLEVLNASCPGETTASFRDVTAQSNGCQNTLQTDLGYRDAYPLHVEYESADQSQLEFAVEALREDDDVELVTLQIGANDAFLCQQTSRERCSGAAELQALAQDVQAAVDTILSTIRDEGGYDGQLVVVTYYALDYSNAFGIAAGAFGDGIVEIAEAHDAVVADGYEAFRPRAEEAGGDSIAAGLVLPNDVHPTDEGQQLLADAVMAVVEG